MTHVTDTSSATYYYITNLQGDVIYLIDANSKIVATYTYDPYGKVLTAEGTVAELNPLRYHGYYYDAETGFYYLQSRYYDPAICRFINADEYASTGLGFLGCNMFAYYNNNPIAFGDDMGTHPARRTTVLFNDGGSKGAHIDITDKLNDTMINDAMELQSIGEDYDYLHMVVYFVENVKPGGDWDFKSQDDWNLDPNRTYLYGNQRLRFDDIGNIHYGFVGRMMFDTSTLLAAGGIVQIITKTSDLSYWKSNFDDPQDQWAIAFGANLWDKGLVNP